MSSQFKFIAFFTFCLFMISCQKEIPSIGNKTVTIFENQHLYFDLNFKTDPFVTGDSIFRLDAGRVLVKKVKLPHYGLQPKTTVKVNLMSNGDPWDKSGSLFVIPKTSDISLVDFETGKFDLKQLKQDYAAVAAFKNDTISYSPNVELLRFMTPFGVGYFNDHERVKKRKPIYIPEWEKEVSWSKEITHILPLLEDEVYIGVFIDTWTKEGYKISVTIDFEESQVPAHIKKEQKVLPLVNTVKYASDQRLFDDFSRKGVALDFSIDEPVKNAKLYYTTTGHGGHSGGDEFVKKENQIYLDNQLIRQFTPWRDDCASFRRFNPTSAVWARKVAVDGEEWEDRLASSDLSRSNWCPGSSVAPEIISLDNLEQGEHTLKIEIPEAQTASEQENNYWMVSAYIVYENE